MIQKSAVTGLTKPLALQRFDEATQKLPGAVVEMIEQDDGKWTVTIVFDANQGARCELRGPECVRRGQRRGARPSQRLQPLRERPWQPVAALRKQWQGRRHR